MKEVLKNWTLILNIYLFVFFKKKEEQGKDAKELNMLMLL